MSISLNHSQAVVVDRTVYVSGTIGLNPDVNEWMYNYITLSMMCLCLVLRICIN